MESLLLTVGIGVLLGMAFMIYKLQDLKKPEDQKLVFEYIEALRKEMRESGTENRKEVQQRLDVIQERLSKGLEVSSQTIQKQFSQSSKLISEVTQKLTKLDETNKQVLNFSEQMQSLENILKKINPGQGIFEINAQIQGIVQTVRQFYLNDLGCILSILKEPTDILVVGLTITPG